MAEEVQNFNFGKRLAHTEKKVRDQALRGLTQWLVSKDDLTELELMKLWKALFYCFWMSDKQPVQLHLAERLAGLTLELKGDLPLRYVEAFWKTMAKEWRGLDRLRLDKFYMLLRKFHGAAFKYLEKESWKEERVTEYLDILRRLPLKLNDANGIPESLCYHTGEAYIEELQKAVGKKVPAETCTQLLDPYFDILSRNASTQIYERVREHIFDKVLEVHASAAESGEEAQVSFDLAAVGRRIYEVALAPVTLKKNRPFAKELFKKYSAVVDCGVDASLLDDKARKPIQKTGRSPTVSGETNGTAVNGKRKAETDEPAPKKKKKKAVGKANGVEVGQAEAGEEVAVADGEDQVLTDGGEEGTAPASPAKASIPETPQTAPTKKSKKAAKTAAAARHSDPTGKKAVRWDEDLEKIKYLPPLRLLDQIPVRTVMTVTSTSESTTTTVTVPTPQPGKSALKRASLSPTPATKATPTTKVTTKGKRRAVAADFF
ncbi:ribosomal RNA-processing protein 1 [Rhizophlyctis rosea]|nr:ribosomal RNA-processing protein 1 [Rhizophlyctis rosea]